MISEFLPRLIRGESLSADEMRAAIGSVMHGSESPEVVASFLTAIRMRGETAEELTGAALSLREAAIKPTVHRSGIADTCGTGGAPVCTFNVSTAAAIVASACGLPIAKHGNRSFSSSSGSADVLAALRVNIEAPHEVVCKCLDEIGLAFFFAPLWHPAMKHVGPVRRALGFRTLFNLVGPLANPAPIEFQLLGVGQRDSMIKMAEAARLLGIRRAAIVWAEDGVDEVSLSARTHVLHVTPSGTTSLSWVPEDFGLNKVLLRDLEIGGPRESAKMILSVLDGIPGPPAEITIANAAATLWTAGIAREVREGVVQAREAIASGAAKHQLERLVAGTNR